MWAGSRNSRGGSLRAALLLAALSSCALDFDVSKREFACPLEVALTGCNVCGADGSCIDLAVVTPMLEPPPDPPPPVGPSPGEQPAPTRRPDAGTSQEPTLPTKMPPPHPPEPDGGPPDPVPPDGGTPPPVPEFCRDYQARTSDSLCLDGGQQCFSLGSVLSPALAAWLDPTTLPQAGSRYWCDRSGQQHHAALVPDALQVSVEADGRAVTDALAHSLLLDSNWLTLGEGMRPAVAADNFAVLVAAAALETPDQQPFELFESGADSRINLSIVPSSGKAEGVITTNQTALVTGPVVTRSSVYDGGFHLYSLYRRSEVRVLDDVLQLRLNGVLEFRGSSVAFPRLLDFSSPQPPSVGSRSTLSGRSATGRGRIAAVVILRGSIPEDELHRLENFLCSALAVCSAPPSAAALAPAQR